MAAFSEDQLRALRVRSTLSKPPYTSRFEKGVRDAQNQLATILRLYPDDETALRRNLRAYLAEGPSWDCEAYQDGGETVHRDVSGILDGYREVIAELLETIEPQPEGESA